MKRIFVKSSAIRTIGYDSKNSVLEIEFNGGAIWEYYDVPKEIFQEFISADSIGRYFINNIKDVYEEMKIR